MGLVSYWVGSKCDSPILATGDSIFMKLHMREQVVTNSQHPEWGYSTMSGGFPQIWSNCKKFSTIFFLRFPFLSFTRLHPKPCSMHMRYRSTVFDARMCILGVSLEMFPFWWSMGLKTSILSSPHRKFHYEENHE